MLRCIFFQLLRWTLGFLNLAEVRKEPLIKDPRHFNTEKSGGLRFITVDGERVTSGYHSFMFNSKSQLLLGKKGAMVYVIDPYTGNQVTGGHHSIKANGSVFMGKTGATGERLGNLSRYQFPVLSFT